MDWSRAKNVLIYAFLLLNIVLGYQLWQDVRDRMHSDLDWTSLSEETRQIMDVKHIQVPAKIPAETPTLREITYRFVNRGTERVPIQTPKDSTIIFLEKELIRSLQGDIRHIEMYRYDELSGKPGTFVLHQRLANGLPIFEVSLELSVSEQKITAYRQQYVELIETKSNKEQKILPASQALGSVIEKVMPGSIVKDIRLGYHGQIFDAETQVSAPSWRIMLENEVYYVNAINGAVDNSQAGKKEIDK
ncbi:two-component system regulatory protein YycI [Paenibacillus profundus]|uniref:Two-component system regulatory protein YycI n=1 Tax=Paenibacillus profundus TaxID=1173085 RepID=A0ABS8YLL8_9BACL|nr:two-component system regulatory protein YycI [Paenibacillus profundus]MCE5172457.1 two-component system regulatory protein YycI [Paenibacillus profundus]